MFRSALFVSSVIASQLVAGNTATAESVESFYKGKTAKIIIGAEIGGSYGLYGQLASRHLGRFIPGSPTFVIQSMPGADGLVSLNYLGAVAPRDGSVISVAHVAIITDGLFNSKAKFATKQFQWIGRLTSIAIVGVTTRKSGIVTIGDARNREVIAGSSGLNSIPGQLPFVLNTIARTKFKVTTGYQGTNSTFIALERGEVEMAAASMDSLRALHWEKLQNGELVPIVAQAGKRLTDFPNVPILLEFSSNDVEKAYLKVLSVAAEIGRSLATPPGVPADRLDALRSAFNAMIVDAQFRADAERLRLSLEPLTGDELQQMVTASIAMTPQTHENVRMFQEEIFKGAK